MKKIINIFQIISMIIGITLIVLFLVPTICGIKPHIVLSGSMEPQIKTGAVAYVNTHMGAEKIKVGDIIAFKVENKQVTHRVIAINEDNTFTTKGDANETEDIAPVKFENCYGKTVFSIPYLGRIMSTFKTRVGSFIVYTIIGLNIVCIIFSNGNCENEEDEKNGISIG